MKRNVLSYIILLLIFGVGVLMYQHRTTPAPSDQGLQPYRSVERATGAGQSSDQSSAPNRDEYRQKSPTGRSGTGRGALQITSEPTNAAIYLSGRRYGNTPLTIEELPAEGLDLRLELKYFKPYEERLVLPDGGVLERHVPLQRGEGSIRVTTRPVSARVTINEIDFYDPTPVLIEHLRAGRHVLRVHADRYHDETRQIDLQAGETLNVEIILSGGNLVRYNGRWMDPDVAAARKQDDVARILAEAETALAAGDLDRSRSLLEKARMLLPDSGNVAEVLNKLEKLLADQKNLENTRRLETLLGRARMLESEGRYAEALALCEKILSGGLDRFGVTGAVARLRDRLADLLASKVTGRMILVRGGDFIMGCASWTGDCHQDASPPHQVTLKDFYLGRFEITQKQWRELMGDNPSHHRGCEQCPVENVSWDESQKFIERLNKLTERRYRLPTEAEWEFAARSGGREEKWSGTNRSDRVGDHSWTWENSGQRAHLVGEKQPNSLGLYDMTGNVEEWCSDIYTATYYSSSPSRDPKGEEAGPFRVVRGGHWNSSLTDARTVVRYHAMSHARQSALGFRIAIDAREYSRP